VAHEHPLRRALPLVLLAGMCFSTLDATAKYLIQAHPLFLVVWARYAGQALVVTPMAWHRGGNGFWRTRNPRLQVLRSLCLVSATACFFGGLRYLPLAEGSAISFLAPLLAVVLSGPVLGEKPGRARLLAAFGGFAGILILLRPGSAVFHPAVVLLLGAAVSNAFYQLLTRKLLSDPPYTTLFYTALVGAAVLTALIPGFEMHADIRWHQALLLLLVLGLLAGIGHWLFITAFTIAPASLVAPFTYVHMVWATLYGYFIFGHLPDKLSGLGMAVIVASGIALVVHERRRR
jgi:drug/metabolite transporter (DMT)-like permease